MSRGASGFDGLDEVDFAVGSVTGVRVWKMGAREAVLRGQNGYQWADGENVAECVRGCEQVPGDECGCGFWAYWEMSASLVFDPGEWAVVGVVEGYGRTVIGERGFRSERARIVAFCLAFDIYRGNAGGWTDVFRLGERHPDELAIKAEIEDCLGLAYPSAQVRRSREAMLALHPTTKDYLPAVPESVPSAETDPGWTPIVGPGVGLSARQKALLQNWPGRIINMG